MGESHDRSRRRLLGGFAWLGLAPLVSRTGVAAGKPSSPFEYEVVPGASVPERMKALRKIPRCIPVVLGAPDHVEERRKMAAARSGDDVRTKGDAVDIKAWLKARRAEEPDYFSAGEGPGEATPPLLPYMSARDILTGQWLPKVAIARCIVDHPWDVAAVMQPGGWNECPPPEVHLAFFKSWYERYGAVVTCISDDVIEMDVPRPPVTPEAAKALAEEQFVYCPDIVLQGVESVASLALALKGSSHWYFWWD